MSSVAILRSVNFYKYGTKAPKKHDLAWSNEHLYTCLFVKKLLTAEKNEKKNKNKNKSQHIQHYERTNSNFEL